MAYLIPNHQVMESGAIPPRARVLLVDEDFRDLEYYRSILLQRGYEVRVIGSYSEAEQCLRKEVFDFVIVGQGSNAFEGRPVVERALEIDRHTPVVVLARCLYISCYLEAMQLGATDYIEKPLTPLEISRLIETHLRTPHMVA